MLCKVKTTLLHVTRETPESHKGLLSRAAAPAFLALAPYPAVLTNAAAPACFACLLACRLLQGPIGPGSTAFVQRSKKQYS
jgi:hypothetical protein